MFRQMGTFVGGWKDKTVEAMHKRRFEAMVAQLPNLGAERLENLSVHALERRLERCWIDVERKPIRKQQEAVARAAVLSNIERQADCLSQDEHELVERALILGGCAQINDMPELEAAQALSLRLWGNVGLVSGKPFLELDPEVLRPVATAFARSAHEEIRQRFDAFHRHMNSLLYQAGVLDDRHPQKMILRDVLQGDNDVAACQLARQYLWASYDCMDYEDGVLLVHDAFAEPKRICADMRRRTGLLISRGHIQTAFDILPEEIPLQVELERVIAHALRENKSAYDVATSIRFLCKQGAPLVAMEEVLQSALIVHLTPEMRGALRNMYYAMPKWIENSERLWLQ